MAQDKRLFDDAELNELQSILESLPEESAAMDAGVLDGYLTAVALNPAKPSDEDVLPYIFSEDGDPEAMPDNARLFELIGMRRREIEASLATGGGLDPIIFPLADENDEEILEGEEAIEAIEPWATGFIYGWELWPEDVAEDEEIAELLRPISRCIPEDAYSPDDDTPEAAEKLKAFLANLHREGDPKTLEDALYDVVKAVFDMKAKLSPNKPIRREEPRVGRNDPCPCGSGKKYKQCCGKN